MWDPLEKNHIIQNLVDAGCDTDMIGNFLFLMERETYGEQIQLLGTHRKMLLEALHQEQKRIDCLDYLLYQLEKQHGRIKSLK